MRCVQPSGLRSHKVQDELIKGQNETLNVGDIATIRARSLLCNRYAFEGARNDNNITWSAH